MKKKIINQLVKTSLVIGILATLGTLYICNRFPKGKTATSTKINIDQSSKVNLIIDVENIDVLPKRFRMSNTKIIYDNVDPVNFTGLSELNTSGSGAFSEKSLCMIKQKIGEKCLTIVDLRQESHGFVNGLGISWFGKNNWANIGLTRDQVIMDEKNKLKKISDKKYVAFDKLEPRKSVNTIPEIKDPQKVQTEEELARELEIGYLRIPVTDHLGPLDDGVDLFVRFIKNMPEKTWIHFHCRGGAGRTTTFMCMYDMMRNSKKVSFEDIMKRQMLLGGSDLLKIEDEGSKSVGRSRNNLLKQFYMYCHSNKDDFQTLWSQWVSNQA